MVIFGISRLSTRYNRFFCEGGGYSKISKEGGRYSQNQARLRKRLRSSTVVDTKKLEFNSENEILIDVKGAKFARILRSEILQSFPLQIRKNGR